jgi:hypothetical protein
MQFFKSLRTFTLCLVLLAAFGGSAAAESYYECNATGVEKNGDRRADVKIRVDSGGNIIAGQIKFARVCKDKSTALGGEYTYAGGSKLIRDQGPYEWIMEANWTGTNDNCSEKVVNNQGTVMVRKFKIQNVAEMQLKGKDGTVWFIFPHGWQYKQVSGDDKPKEDQR